MGRADESARKQIDAALARWRQGDCFVGVGWFAFRLDTASPLTEAAAQPATEGIDLADVETPGFVVVTQTCDLVRDCASRPFVEICPLVRVEERHLHEIERGRRPNYAFIPALASQSLVADLDRTMTVEKGVVATWERVAGWTTDDEGRRFALALGRKRTRYAFPDDFVEFSSKLQKRLLSKHDKESPEGKALRALREIRVVAAPSWDAEVVDITFLFIRDPGEDEVEDKTWDEHLDKWLELTPASGRFAASGLVQTLDDLTARDYVESDSLDLDYLSVRGASRERFCRGPRASSARGSLIGQDVARYPP